MRNQLLLLASFPLLFSSCLKSDDSELHPVTPGIILYGVTSYQNAVATDAASAAFRLNILLSTAEQKGTDPESVTVDGVDGTLKDHLLGATALTQSKPGVYTLGFNPGSTGTDDFAREGEIVVDTGGKLLSELEQGETWIITNGGSGTYNVTIDSYTYTVATGTYYIMKSGPCVYDLYVSGLASTSGTATGNWNLSFSISHNLEQASDGVRTENPMTWDNVSATTLRVYVTGDAGGIPADNDIEFDYEIQSRLEYRPVSCGWRTKILGTERTAVRNASDLNIDEFPKNSVKYRWKEGATSCTPYFEISYNGYTYDSDTSTTTTDTSSSY